MTVRVAGKARRGNKHVGVIGRSLLLALLALGLTACSSAPKVLRFQMPDLSQGQVWPAPPEQPRLRYVGDLIGETNLTGEDLSQESGRSWLEILTGAGLLQEEERVLLKRPQAGMVDSQGRILVTDVGQGGVFVFDEVNGTLDLWDRYGMDRHFSQPIGITEGPDGSIYVADSDKNYVVMLTRDGKFIKTLGGDVLKRPTGLAVDAIGQRLFVADSSADDIKVFSLDGSLQDTWGSSGVALGELNGPVYLSYRDDSLYVTDTLNARVQVFDQDGMAKREIGRRGMYLGNMVRPKGVTLDSSGNVYVVESYYDYLLIYNQDGEFLLPLGGTGSSAGRFFLPAGIWSDSRDRIFVADMLNGRISIFQYLSGPASQPVPAVTPVL